MVRRAALFGCNYAGTDNALSGCINDVTSVHEMLVHAYQFEPRNIITMTDDREPRPTGANMKGAISQQVQLSGPGDVLFIHYSGHGTQVPITDDDPNEEEDDGMDEAICPCDMNLITDDDMADLLAPLHPGVKCTIVADCCHSGTLLDYGQINLAMGNAAMAGQYSRESVHRSMQARQFTSNRSIPYSSVANTLSQFLGKDVPYGQIFAALKQNFGTSATGNTGGKVMGFVSSMSKIKFGGSGGGGGGGGSSGLGAALGGIFGGGGRGGGGSSGMGAALGGMFGGGNHSAQGTTEFRANTAHASRAMGCLVSGCRDHETSADACPSGDSRQAFGALTNAITTTIKNNTTGRPLTNIEVVSSVRHFLAAGGYEQNPCLSCAEQTGTASFII